eukprot:1617902-Pyramimonas_sp.AAC.1
MSLCRSNRHPTLERSPSRDAGGPAASPNAGAPADELPRAPILRRSDLRRTSIYPRREVRQGHLFLRHLNTIGPVRRKLTLDAASRA